MGNRYYRRFKSKDGLVHHSFVREDGEELDEEIGLWRAVYTRETRCGITPRQEMKPERCDVPYDPGPVTCFTCLTNTEPTFDEIQ